MHAPTCAVRASRMKRVFMCRTEKGDVLLAAGGRAVHPHCSGATFAHRAVPICCIRASAVATFARRAAPLRRRYTPLMFIYHIQLALFCVVVRGQRRARSEYEVAPLGKRRCDMAIKIPLWQLAFRHRGMIFRFCLGARRLLPIGGYASREATPLIVCVAPSLSRCSAGHRHPSLLSYLTVSADEIFLCRQRREPHRAASVKLLR